MVVFHQNLEPGDRGLEPPADQITQLLERWSIGDQSALEKLMPLVYDELHRLARRYMTDERRGHTLQATALVNEAYLRLVDFSHPRWECRSHFFAACAQVMRRILVDWARSRRAQKRGGGHAPIELEEILAFVEGPATDLVAIDDALTALAAIDKRKSQVVEMRFFGGLSNAALYMAWTTAGGTIDVASYTGGSWAPLAGAPVMASPAANMAPALAIYNGVLFLAWLEGTTVKYATYSLSGSGGPWSAATVAGASITSSVPPALGVNRYSYKELLSAGLYMAWNTSGGVSAAEWEDGTNTWGAIYVPGLPIPPGPLTPALNFIYTIPQPLGLCGVTTYDFALVYAAPPVSGESPDNIYLRSLDYASYQSLGCKY